MKPAINMSVPLAEARRTAGDTAGAAAQPAVHCTERNACTEISVAFVAGVYPYFSAVRA